MRSSSMLPTSPGSSPIVPQPRRRRRPPGTGRGCRAGRPCPPPRRRGARSSSRRARPACPRGRRAATRASPTSSAPPACSSGCPFRVGDVHVVPAPMFHSLGNGALLMGAQHVAHAGDDPPLRPGSGAPPDRRHRARGMTAVPVMLQRMVGPARRETRAELDTSSARGRAVLRARRCPARWRIRWMDIFGDNLHNMYGSTEVAAATVATPADLRAAPGTAGRPLAGVEVRLYDDDDRVVTAPGVDGRIFVGQRPALRRLHRRSDEGVDRRPAVDRRPRSLGSTTAGSSSAAATTT